MRITSFSPQIGRMKLVPESFDDLYLIQRVIAPGDVLEARSYRRFKPSEGDKGEQKEVLITLSVEKADLDKGAAKLRVNGKILAAKPEEFARLSSYHTISIGTMDHIELYKKEWKDYIVKRLREAVAEAKKPRLGVIAMDDEKATVAYSKGYGIEIITELYSKLSKRMNQQDFQKQKDKFFNEVCDVANGMEVDIVVIAGPGFTKDDLKKFIAEGKASVEKKLFYVPASDAERSGIREALRSESVSKLLEKEHVRKEFVLLNRLLEGLKLNGSYCGYEKVKESLEEYDARVVLVNDTMLNDPSFKELLEKADMSKVEIAIFNASDDAGMQLANLGNIASISKRME